jgi:hypothetical protein
MRVLSIRAILFCCVLLPSIDSAAGQSTQEFQARALFELIVQKSQVLKVGKSQLQTRSAFVTYTNEFFGGKTAALKVQFFTRRVVEETRARLLRGDHAEIGKDGYAALVLFLDEQKRIWQANLTYVIPGATVVRTVASNREELTKYFSDYHFDNGRLRLKSKGSYNTAPGSKEEILTLSWDTDLDIPVFDQSKK